MGSFGGWPPPGLSLALQGIEEKENEPQFRKFAVIEFNRYFLHRVLESIVRSDKLFQFCEFDQQ